MILKYYVPITVIIVILIAITSTEQLVRMSDRTGESVANFLNVSGAEPCFLEKKIILNCYANYFSELSSSVAISDKLPHYDTLKMAGINKADICPYHARLSACLSTVPSCIVRGTFCTLLSSEEDADLYLRHIVGTALQCTQPKIYEEFLDCSYRISTANNELMTKLAGCASPMVTCQEISSTIQCELPIFKQLCSSVSAVCQYHRYQLPLLGTIDKNCIENIYENCVRQADTVSSKRTLTNEINTQIIDKSIPNPTMNPQGYVVHGQAMPYGEVKYAAAILRISTATLILLPRMCEYF